MRRPLVQISIGGVLADLALGASLRQFTYADAYHGETDDLSFEVADPRGLWRAGWNVDEGTEMSARIGYVGGALVPCGDFVVDEPSASGDGSGDVAAFNALSASTTKDLRTKRSEAYDGLTLDAIVRRVAARHELDPVLDVPDLTFTRISQNKQADLTFLTRMADDYGCYFTIKGKQLVFIKRSVVEAADPVRVFSLASPGLKR